MDRFPHKCIIMRPVQEANDPYSTLSAQASYVQVYSGKCRCFLLKAAALRVGKIMDCDYKVVFQDRSMIDIGENWKIAIKFQNSQNNKTWDIVGFVKDFARYDRVCEIYFQMMKENIIYEDIPKPAKGDDPVVFGLDMSCVRFSTKDFDTTSKGIEMPVWARFGDWSEKKDWLSTFEECTFERYSFADMSACERLVDTFKNIHHVESITFPQVLPNCTVMAETFFGMSRIEELVIPSIPNMDTITNAFGGTNIGRLVFNGDLTCNIQRAFVDAQIDEIVFFGKILGRDAYDPSGQSDGSLGDAFVECDWSHECLLSILNALGECNVEVNKVGIGPDNIAKLTASEKHIAEGKGWELV